MMELKLERAEVININDPDNKGRIQVRVLPDLENVEDSLLPWVWPFNTLGMSSDEFSMNLPDEGSMVWVVFNHREMFREGFYLSGSYIPGHFKYGSVESSINGIADTSNVSYPDVRFYKSKSGNIYFENTDNGECGLLQANGTYAVFNDGGFVLDNGNGHFELESGGAVVVNNNLRVEP